MKIYVTRHGQVEFNTEYYDNNPLLPKGEVLLSEMGRVQAMLLGKRLKKLDFSGKIFASPLLRTMETAELIAKETGSKIIPTTWMQEIFADRETIDSYKGYALEELRKYYSCIDESAELSSMWWVMEPETYESVRERVADGIKNCMQDQTEDILLVGHGASARAAHEQLGLKKGGFIWNCGLGMYDRENPENNYGNDVSHIPDEMVTTNRVLGIDLNFDSDDEILYSIEIPEKLRKSSGTKLLHIGDAPSDSYIYYKQLISAVKPDIIVYTGDSADEIKVGVYPELRKEYLAKIAVLFDILKKSGSKVYWVSGNNDLPDEVRNVAPFAQILKAGTVLDFDGVKISFTHKREEIIHSAEIYMYGHSRNGESWEDEFKMSGEGTMSLNALRSSNLCILPQKELYVFDNGYERI